MLRNMGMQMNCSMPVQEKSQTTWERNEKEDMKLAIEYLYDFHEKLIKLHPECRNAIHNMLQDVRRY